MRNLKLEYHLDSDEHWPLVSLVTVPGNPDAPAIPANATQPQAEKIIQAWEQIAVLKVSPVIPVYYGFAVGSHAQFLNVPIETTTDGCFGAHIGDHEVTWFVFAKDLHARPEVELVEVTTVDNAKYANLPLY